MQDRGKVVSYDLISNVVAQYFGIHVADLSGPKFTRRYSRARTVALGIASAFVKHSTLREVGAMFGRDVKQVARALEQLRSGELLQEYEDCVHLVLTNAPTFSFTSDPLPITLPTQAQALTTQYGDLAVKHKAWPKVVYYCQECGEQLGEERMLTCAACERKLSRAVDASKLSINVGRRK